MASHTCGYCQHKVVMRLHGEPYVAGRLSTGDYVWEGAFVCDGCNNLSVAITTSRESYRPPDTSDWDRDFVKWFPEKGEVREFPDVPEKIAACAAEAVRCSSIGAQRGAVLLARTTIEATAKHYGIQIGNLQSKIDAMAKEGLIRDGLAQAAHGVRLLANDQAHGDLDEPVTRDDADAVITVMVGVFAATFEQDAAREHLEKRLRGDRPTL